MKPRYRASSNSSSIGRGGRSRALPCADICRNGIARISRPAPARSTIKYWAIRWASFLAAFRVRVRNRSGQVIRQQGEKAAPAETAPKTWQPGSTSSKMDAKPQIGTYRYVGSWGPQPPGKTFRSQESCWTIFAHPSGIWLKEPPRRPYGRSARAARAGRSRCSLLGLVASATAWNNSSSVLSS